MKCRENSGMIIVYTCCTQNYKVHPSPEKKKEKINWFQSPSDTILDQSLVPHPFKACPQKIEKTNFDNISR